MLVGEGIGETAGNVILMPGRVLLVEDEPLIRALIADEMAAAGYTVTEASNGREAMTALEASPDFDFLFTDIRIPGIVDGWGIAERARSLNPDIGVVYATGYSAEPPRQVEGSYLLTKPYKPEEAVRALQAVAS
jgi:CheY-like chemotaxis protein